MSFLSDRGYGKLQNDREKSGKSQGILRWMISGNPEILSCNSRLPFRRGMTSRLQTGSHKNCIPFKTSRKYGRLRIHLYFCVLGELLVNLPVTVLVCIDDT